jgi:hypothetical protein
VAAPARKRGKKAGRSWLPLLAVVLGGLLAGIAGLAYWSTPRGAHGWQSLGAGEGEARWVETTQGGPIAPPMAPEWVRRLRRLHIPWPTDLPTAPSPASFGAGGDTPVVWLLVRSATSQKELWHVEKSSVRLVDAARHEIPWEGGSGAARVAGDEPSQLLYLRLPPELAGAPGTKLHLRLTRLHGPASAPLTFHLD